MNSQAVIISSIVSYVAFIEAVPPQACFANFRSDDCGHPPTPVVYYWKPGSRCEVGIWRGCLPSLNMFKSEYECVSTCIFTVRPRPLDYHKVAQKEVEMGDKTGDLEGEQEDEPESEQEGEPESEQEGEPEGEQEGEPEGEQEGEPDGEQESVPEGKQEDQPEGEQEGEPEGVQEGEPEGKQEGETEGKQEGELEGENGT